MNERKIAHALLDRWKQSEKLNKPTLEGYLRARHKCHVVECEQLGIKPMSFAKWLQKPVNTVNS